MGQAYEEWEEYSDELSLKDYRRMLQNDGQIQMLYNAIVNTILANGFYVQDDDDIEEEESDEKKFIEEVLFTPAYKGGMSTSFNLVNRTAMRAFVEGFRVFEVVYKKRDDGKVGIEKLAPRAGLHDDDIILYHDKGEFVGIKQKIWNDQDISEVEIMNNGGVHKVVKATFGEEFGSLYGQSGFKAAWYHYDKAHKSMYLNHVGQELGATKFRILETGQVNDEKRDAAMNLLSKITSLGVFSYPEEEMTLQFADVSDADVMEVGLEQQDRHYALMSKSVLAQFIDLGSAIAKTGSRALGDSQIAFFKDSLQNVAEVVLERMWNTVIGDLVMVNFNNDIYPRLKIKPINDKAAKALLNGMQALVTKGDIPVGFRDKFLLAGSNEIGIDITTDDMKTDELQEIGRSRKPVDENPVADKMSSDTPVPDKNVNNNLDNKLKSRSTSDINLQDNEDDRMVRSLHPVERKVKILDIKNTLDEQEEKSRRALNDKLANQKAELIEQYLNAMKDGRKSIKNIEVDLQDGRTKYSEELEIIALQVLNYGKIMAANELDEAVPNTDNKAKNLVSDRVDTVTEEQSTRLKLRMDLLANEMMARDIDPDNAALQLEREYDSFVGKLVVPTVGILIPFAFNIGRDNTFRYYDDVIEAYMYSAILDNRTTNFCRTMDGAILRRDDPDYYLLEPPNHWGCRSFYVAIKKGEMEEFNLEVTGKPEGVTVFGSVSQFRKAGDMSDILI